MKKTDNQSARENVRILFSLCKFCSIVRYLYLRDFIVRFIFMIYIFFQINKMLQFFNIKIILWRNVKDLASDKITSRVVVVYSVKHRPCWTPLWLNAGRINATAWRAHNDLSARRRLALQAGANRYGERYIGRIESGSRRNRIVLPESLRTAKGLASFALITRRQWDNAIDRRAIIRSNRFNLSVSIWRERINCRKQFSLN